VLTRTGRGRRARSRSQGGDDGFTLVELIVSMGIFSILLVVFTAGITSMSRTTTR
jgi:prepilin-type N-terminal cleavage/methylation domain-containing protein